MNKFHLPVVKFQREGAEGSHQTALQGCSSLLLAGWDVARYLPWFSGIGELPVLVDFVRGGKCLHQLSWKSPFGSSDRARLIGAAVTFV